MRHTPRLALLASALALASLAAQAGEIAVIVKTTNSTFWQNVHKGAEAAVIGRVLADHPGMAVGRTRFGTTRVIERELGEQLPRIC